MTVSLSDRSRKLCEQLGVPENVLKAARSGSVSETEGSQYLIVWGELPDGRRVRMMCSYANRGYIVTWRPVS